MTRRRIRRQKRIHEARRYIHAAEMQIYQYTLKYALGLTELLLVLQQTVSVPFTCLRSIFSSIFLQCRLHRALYLMTVRFSFSKRYFTTTTCQKMFQALILSILNIAFITRCQREISFSVTIFTQRLVID